MAMSSDVQRLQTFLETLVRQYGDALLQRITTLENRLNVLETTAHETQHALARIEAALRARTSVPWATTPPQQPHAPQVYDLDDVDWRSLEIQFGEGEGPPASDAIPLPYMSHWDSVIEH